MATLSICTKIKKFAFYRIKGDIIVGDWIFYKAEGNVDAEGYKSLF